MPPAVETQGLSRRFGIHHAVRGVTMTVEGGSVLVVVGPNGAGKTTLLRLLATAIRPTRGRGAVFGRDLVREADAVRRLTVLVGVGGGAYGALSGEENLAFAAAMAGARASPAEIAALLDRVGLAAAAERPVRAYSQGMQRRLALARAWLQRPRLLLLDDPFGALDADGAALAAGLIEEVRRAGGAAVLAAPTWERSVPVVDRVMLLEGGRQVESEVPPRLRAVAGGHA